MSSAGEQTPPVAAASAGSDATNRASQHRRRRAQLSCAECRAKKMSCDRKLPCARCVRSRKPELCSYPGGVKYPVTPAANSSELAPLTGQIRDLQAEVAHLRMQLDAAGLQKGHYDQTHAATTLTASVPLPDVRAHGGIIDTGPTLVPGREQALNHARSLGGRQAQTTDSQQRLVPKELYSRPMQGYYRQHCIFRFFHEIPSLFPFIRETADENFKPRSIGLRKAKITPADVHDLSITPLATLLPPDEDTECLLVNYLDHFENVHRVVHSPLHDPVSDPHFASRLRVSLLENESKTALAISMISLSASIIGRSPACPGSESLETARKSYQRMVPTWISACEKWLRQQGSKGRDLEYYQVGCLIYLAKRANGIRKKRFWSETGALIQDAVMYGLHRDPPSTDSPYAKEMKRRIWSTLRELDLQNSFEHGLPTLLYSLGSDVAAPANVEDHEFHKDSETMRTRPVNQYTRASYQHLSATSWRLRLEISRLLYGTGSGPSQPLSHEDVLRYTHEVTEALDSLPSWSAETAGRDGVDGSGRKVFLLAPAFLQCQLKVCLLAIHRHRMQRDGAGFSSLSERICYQTSQDILSIHNVVAAAGLRSLGLIRTDAMMAGLTLARIGLQQPTHATVFATTNHESTLALTVLEQFLPLIEDKYLHYFNSEPWWPLTMLGAISLLKMHLGKETRQAAKASCAQRFLGLYYRHCAEQQTALPHEPDTTTPSETVVNFDFWDMDVNWGKLMELEQSWLPEEGYEMSSATLGVGDAVESS